MHSQYSRQGDQKATSLLYSAGIGYFPFPLLPPLLALFFSLAVEEEEANRLSLVCGEVALMSTSVCLSLVQNTLSHTGRCHYCFMGELSLLSPEPNRLQASTNPLTSVLTLGSQTFYDSVVPHVK